jgi:tetratricopeptide (TPR) repeat protein
MLAAQGHADAARTVLAEVREHGDPALQVAALIVFGQIATDQGAFTSARDDLRMALALNELQPDGVTRSRILSKLSWVAFMRGEFAEMRELALAALDQGRRIGSLSAQAEALRRLGMAEVSQLNFADATAATTAALELYQQIGDREGIAASMHNIGQIYRVQQDYPNAIAYCDQGLALFRELGGRRNLSMCLFTRGAVSCAQANFAEATTFLRDGLELALANEDRWVIAASYGRLATVALATGDQPTGIAYLQRALHEATSIRVQSITLWTLIGYAQLWCQQNRLTDAAALVGMVLAHPAAGSDAPILAQPVIAVLRTQLASAELEAALAHGRTQDLATTVAAIQATN